MTDRRSVEGLDLKAIRERHDLNEAQCEIYGKQRGQPHQDRGVLLAEVERLREAVSPPTCGDAGHPWICNCYPSPPTGESPSLPVGENMDKRERGLYEKFRVQRVDETDRPGGKHEGCEYFVLDLTHDPHAAAAIVAYAASCRNDYPLLARDLDAKAAVSERPQPDIEPFDTLASVLADRAVQVTYDERCAILADALAKAYQQGKEDAAASVPPSVERQEPEPPVKPMKQWHNSKFAGEGVGAAGPFRVVIRTERETGDQWIELLHDNDCGGFGFTRRQATGLIPLLQTAIEKMRSTHGGVVPPSNRET